MAGAPPSSREQTRWPVRGPPVQAARRRARMARLARMARMVNRRLALLSRRARLALRRFPMDGVDGEGDPHRWSSGRLHRGLRPARVRSRDGLLHPATAVHPRPWQPRGPGGRVSVHPFAPVGALRHPGHPDERCSTPSLPLPCPHGAIAVHPADRHG